MSGNSVADSASSSAVKSVLILLSEGFHVECMQQILLRLASSLLKTVRPLLL